MVRDISINLRLCVFILGGSNQVSLIPVVQYLPYGSTANFLVRAPMNSLQKRIEHHSNSDLRGIKIIKIGLLNHPLFEYNK